jgi:hypothetical protein
MLRFSGRSEENDQGNVRLRFSAFARELDPLLEFN